MATTPTGLNPMWIVVVLFCLVGTGWARDVLFKEEEDLFICPIEGQSGSRKQREPCTGQIGTPYVEESTGVSLRKLLHHFSPYSSRGSGGGSMFDRFFGSGGSRGRSPYDGSSGSGGRYPYGGSSGSNGRYPYRGNSGSGGGFPSGGSSGGGGIPSGSSGFPSTPISGGGGGGGGCSDRDSSVQAVIACTNAVRMNPGAYRYPCSSYWLGEYTRQRRGPLAINNELMRAAQRHSDDQARMRRMSHTGSDGSSVGTRARNSGYGWRGIAENVAYGQRSAKDVVLSWMCSSGHRRNMMSCSYGDLGVGVNCNSGRCYYTQDFGCRGGCGCQGGGSSGGSTGGYNPYSGGFSPSSGGQRPQGSGGSPYDRYRSRYQPQEEPRSSRNPFNQMSPRSPFSFGSPSRYASDSQHSVGGRNRYSGSQRPGNDSPFSRFFNFG